MDLMHLVDRLEELVASAQKMPIGNRAIIDRRRLLDLIDQMRIAIPEEVREAQAMVLRREEVRREAEEEARIIVARAEEHASQLVEQHEITEAARRRADELAREAESRLEDRIQQANDDIQRRIDQSRALAAQQMDAADEYARELLDRLRRQLEAFVRSVDSGIHQLEPDRSIAGPEGPAMADAPMPLGPDAAPTSNETIAHGVDEPEDADAYPPRDDRERREPVPLRQRFPQAEEAEGAADLDEGEPDDEGVEELENLLRRTPARTRPEEDPAPGGVIDDFANPPLDDDPTRSGPDDEPPEA